MARYFLGIDVSTTGAKALLVDDKGKIASLRHHPAHRPDAATPLVRAGPARLVDGRGRQHPEGPREGRGKRRGHGRGRAERPDARPVLLDDDRRVLRPALLWNDQRTAAECAEIERPAGGTSSSARRATPPSPASPRRRSSGSATTSPRSTRRRISPAAEGLHPPAPHRRSGEDKADGSGTLLLDLKARTWSKRVLEKLDIPPTGCRRHSRGRSRPAPSPPRRRPTRA